MCSPFSKPLIEITQLTMHFNTESLNAARQCICLISPGGNKCRGPDGSSNVDGCLFGREVQWRSAIVDKSIISCGRGDIQQNVQGRSYSDSFKIDRNHSDSIMSAATVIRHTVRQYGTYDDAFMAGTIVLSSEFIYLPV